KAKIEFQHRKRILYSFSSGRFLLVQKSWTFPLGSPHLKLAGHSQIRTFRSYCYQSQQSESAFAQIVYSAQSPRKNSDKSYKLQLPLRVLPNPGRPSCLFPSRPREYRKPFCTTSE